VVFRVQVPVFFVIGLGFMVQGLSFMVLGLWFGVWFRCIVPINLDHVLLLLYDCSWWFLLLFRHPGSEGFPSMFGFMFLGSGVRVYDVGHMVYG
jgi:hypothetical protein